MVSKRSYCGISSEPAWETSRDVAISHRRPATTAAHNRIQATDRPYRRFDRLLSAAFEPLFDDLQIAVILRKQVIHVLPKQLLIAVVMCHLVHLKLL